MTRHGGSITGVGRMLAAAVVAGLLAGVPETTRAATADGTLVTGVVCVTFTSVALQPHVVSFCATSTVIVANPQVLALKFATPSIESSGATLTYCIWVSNVSAFTSAFNVHVIDIIPGTAGVMAYVPGQANWVAGTAGATVRLGYGAQPPWNGFLYQMWDTECPAGQSGPYGLRWVVTLIGPGKSALLCWKASIL